MATLFEATRASVHSRDAARCRYVKSTWLGRAERRWYSAAMGSLTFKTSSACAHTSSAVATIVAPLATYASSLMDDPTPAPASIKTWCPPEANSRTPAGVRATRFSSVLISFGTPMIIVDHPFSIESNSRYCFCFFLRLDGVVRDQLLVPKTLIASEVPRQRHRRNARKEDYDVRQRATAAALHDLVADVQKYDTTDEGQVHHHDIGAKSLAQRLSKCPGARQAGDAVIEGHKHTNVQNKVVEYRGRGRRERRQQDPEHRGQRDNDCTHRGRLELLVNGGEHRWEYFVAGHRQGDSRRWQDRRLRRRHRRGYYREDH